MICATHSTSKETDTDFKGQTDRRTDIQERERERPGLCAGSSSAANYVKMVICI